MLLLASDVEICSRVSSADTVMEHFCYMKHVLNGPFEREGSFGNNVLTRYRNTVHFHACLLVIFAFSLFLLISDREALKLIKVPLSSSRYQGKENWSYHCHKQANGEATSEEQASGPTQRYGYFFNMRSIQSDTVNELVVSTTRTR